MDAKAAVAVLPPPEPVRGKPISSAAIRRASAAVEPDTWDLVKGLLSKSSFQVQTRSNRVQWSDSRSQCIMGCNEVLLLLFFAFP